MKPSVSIIIATQNRAESLRETLESLAQVSIPPEYEVELLIADNASTDRTKEIAEAFRTEKLGTARYLYEPQKGQSRTQNLAIRHARGEILLFTDDDVRFPTNWIEGLCGPIARGEADAVLGGIRWAPHLLEECRHSPFLYAVIASTRHKVAEELRDGLIGANMALSRTMCEALGNFDEALGPGALGFGAETFLGWQLLEAGYRKVNVLEVEVEHHFDASRLDRASLLAIAARHGVSEAYIDYHWKHCEESWPGARRVYMAAKDLLRTVLTPAAWPGRATVPPWKYSYQATLSRFAFFQTVAGTERRYERRGRRK